MHSAYRDHLDGPMREIALTDWWCITAYNEAYEAYIQEGFGGRAGGMFRKSPVPGEPLPNVLPRTCKLSSSVGKYIRSHRGVPPNCHGDPPRSPEKQNLYVESLTSLSMAL